MEDSKVDTPVEDVESDKITALKVLQDMYSDMLNEYERQIDELSALSRANRNTLYNPAVLHEIEGMAHRQEERGASGVGLDRAVRTGGHRLHAADHLLGQAVHGRCLGDLR